MNQDEIQKICLAIARIETAVEINGYAGNMGNDINNRAAKANNQLAFAIKVLQDILSPFMTFDEMAHGITAAKHTLMDSKNKENIT